MPWRVAKDIGPRLRALRRALEWSQTEFGAEAGVRYDQVSAWERGKATPPRGRLERLAARRGWPVEIFSEGGPWPTEALRLVASPTGNGPGLVPVGISVEDLLSLAHADRPGLMRYLQTLWGGDPRVPLEEKRAIIDGLERLARAHNAPLPGTLAEALRLCVKERLL